MYKTISVFVVLFACLLTGQKIDLVQYVNTLQGTTHA